MEEESRSHYKMSLFSLIMVSSVLVVSVRNLPTMAETGWQMIFFVIIAAICFFIPAALVSAELATGWPKQGGVYVWVKEALGPRFGFFAIWLQWIYMVFTVISILYFIGGSIAFVIAPHQLAQNRVFLMVVLLVVIWGSTFFCFRGQKTSSVISALGFILGVLVPSLIVVLLGVIYVILKDPIHLQLHPAWHDLFPNIRQIATLVLWVGFMKAFAGIEVSAGHAREVVHPRKNYPIAILFVVIIGIAINVLGSLSIAIVVPQKEISLIAGLMEAFSVFLNQFHLGWFIPIMGFLIAVGAIGSVSAWALGPIKGLLSSAQNGNLPKIFAKVNHQQVPTTLLWAQGILISIIGCLLMLMPNINIAFWVTVALSMMCYFLMYILMLSSAIILRFKKPEVERAYSVPGGKYVGMILVAGIGLLTMIFALMISFVPPAELPTGNEIEYFLVLSLSFTVIILLPFFLYRRSKNVKA